MRRRMLASVGGKPLPYKRRLAYLKSTGTQFIDIGLHGNQNSRFEIGVKCFGTTDNSKATRVFGSQYNTNTSISMYMSNDDYYSIRFGDSGPVVAERLINKGVYTELIFDKTGIRSKDSSITYYRINNQVSAFDTVQNIVLFKNNISTASFGLCEIYYFNMFNENDVVRKMNPVMSHDDEPCFYDEISGQLFRNAGTGTFAYGAFSTEGGGTKCLTPRRSYRRFSRPSARFCAHFSRWEAAA